MCSVKFLIYAIIRTKERIEKRNLNNKCLLEHTECLSPENKEFNYFPYFHEGHYQNQCVFAVVQCAYVVNSSQYVSWILIMYIFSLFISNVYTHTHTQWNQKHSFDKIMKIINFDEYFLSIVLLLNTWLKKKILT